MQSALFREVCSAGASQTALFREPTCQNALFREPTCQNALFREPAPRLPR